jgi:hypothetical protein
VHVSPTGQVHVIWPPQPSETVPHALPTPPDPHARGTQVGWQVPLPAPLHVSPVAHEQFKLPPQPSGIAPQPSPVLPAGQVLTEQPH